MEFTAVMISVQIGAIGILLYSINKNLERIYESLNKEEEE